MQPGLSTHAFFDLRLHPGHLDTLASAGARHIEVFAARHHFDYTAPQAVREVASWFRSHDVRAILHQPLYTSDRADAQWSRHVAPNLNLISGRKQARIAAMDEVKRAIESAELIPFAAVVLHLGLKDSAWDDAAIEYSITAIEHLKAFASPLGVRLLLENLQSEVTTPEHLLYILKAGHFDGVGVCLDIGHLHLSQPGVPPPGADPDSTPALIPVADSGVQAAIELLGDRIAQVHLHDNHGPFAAGEVFSDSTDMKDEHLWPGEGSIDWKRIGPLLNALPAATPFILEPASDRDHTTEQVAKKASEFFSEQLRSAEQAATQV